MDQTSNTNLQQRRVPSAVATYGKCWIIHRRKNHVVVLQLIHVQINGDFYQRFLNVPEISVVWFLRSSEV